MNRLIAHAGLPTGFRRYDLLKLINPLMKQLGLRSDDLRYLHYHIGRTLASDFAPGQICMTWVGVDKIAADLGLNVRTINRIENRLEDAGIIRRVLSSHRKRFGKRNSDKKIISCCGIDLGPLITRAPQLREMLLEKQQVFSQMCTLKDNCKDLLKRIRALNNAVALKAAAELLPRLRPSEVGCLQKLKTIYAGLQDLIAKFETLARQTARTAAPDNSDRRIIAQEDISLSCSRPVKSKSPRKKPSVSPSMIRKLMRTELRDAVDLYASGNGESPNQPSWNTLVLAARDIAANEGIRFALWEKNALKLGNEYAVLAFAIIHRNAERADSKWFVESIPAAFTGIVRLGEEGRSVIDRLWAALVHECGDSS